MTRKPHRRSSRSGEREIQPGAPRGIIARPQQESGHSSSVAQLEGARGGFNSILFRAWCRRSELVARREARAFASAVTSTLIRLRPADFAEAQTRCQKRGFEAAVRLLFERWYPNLSELISTLTPQRDFESLVGNILGLTGFPHERVERARWVDFIMPSRRAFVRDSTVAAVASVSRTLSHGWREVAEELNSTRAPNVFLATADSQITDDQIRLICERYKIYLVVWDQLKQQRFSEQNLVLGYTQWANEHLRPLSQFWS